MKEKLIFSGDGSHTILNSEIDETYHSEKGAISESQHVFINNGISLIDKKELNILEIGFGTGLNALLTYQFGLNNSKKINYHTLEKHPLPEKIVKQLNYSEQLKIDQKIFHDIHNCEWNKMLSLNSFFSLKKYQTDLVNFSFSSLENIDLVYFDAFSPSKQPELWTEDIFKGTYNIMSNDGLLTTYSSAGIVKRALRSAGFKVKRKPGPLGKFHMLIAQK